MTGKENNKEKVLKQKKSLEQLSQPFLAPGSNFTEDNFSMEVGVGWGSYRMIPIRSSQPRSLICAVHASMRI